MRGFVATAGLLIVAAVVAAVWSGVLLVGEDEVSTVDGRGEVASEAVSEAGGLAGPVDLGVASRARARREWDGGGQEAAGRLRSASPRGFEDAEHAPASRTSRRSAAVEDDARAPALWPGALSPSQGRTSTGRRPRGGSHRTVAAEEREAAEPEFGSLRDYLAVEGEDPGAVRDEAAIVDDPSNLVVGDDVLTLLAWDPRHEEPSGSYLYVLEHDGEGRISQVHRYFCPERRLDVLAETCVPIATVYSDRGVPISVTYGADGTPEARAADDLDPRRFSRDNQYVEANELLLSIQQYFDSLRS